VFLRAVVMNPYLHAMRKESGKDLLLDFVTELEREATRVLAKAEAHAPTGDTSDAH